MSNDPTKRANAPPAPASAPKVAKVGPAKGLTEGEYLLQRGWTPLNNDTDSERCLWLEPGFALRTTYTPVTHPMTNEEARHAFELKAHQEGKGHAPRPIKEVTQVVVKPRSMPLFTEVAFRLQLMRELEEMPGAGRAAV